MKSYGTSKNVMDCWILKEFTMNINKRLKEMIDKESPEIQEVILKTLLLEQEYISHDRPRLNKELDEIIHAVAQKSLQKGNA